MNKEIKEIKWPGQILDYVDTKKHLVELFNYITNLQEELKSIKENYKIQLEYDEQLENKINKAIEYIERRDIEWGSEEHNRMMSILRGKEDDN